MGGLTLNSRGLSEKGTFRVFYVEKSESFARLLFPLFPLLPSTHNTTHFPPHIYTSEFKSSQAGFMAQLVAHWSNKPTVVGSSPTGTTFLLFFLRPKWVFLVEIVVVEGVNGVFYTYFHHFPRFPYKISQKHPFSLF